MIVEDDDPLRRAIGRLVRSWKVEVVQATSVQEAKAALAETFDLVITDVRLPDGTGLMVADAAVVRTPAPLMVAISGVASAREAFDLAQRGVHVYVPKPFTPAELTARIEQALTAPEEDPGIPKGSWTVPMPERSQLQLASNVEGFAERHRLTPRQRSLVRLAITGIPRRRYPELLGVTENTCKTMIRRLLHKCGARSLADIPRLMLVEGANQNL